LKHTTDGFAYNFICTVWEDVLKHTTNTNEMLLPAGNADAGNLHPFGRLTERRQSAKAPVRRVDAPIGTRTLSSELELDMELELEWGNAQRNMRSVREALYDVQF
jgi:hypothetical protein